MKVFGRIVYAILAVFAFWFTIDYARGRMTYLYFQDHGNEALAADNDMFFYGSGRAYSNDQALFSLSDSGYYIAFYEVADTEISDNVLTVNTYINVLLKNNTEVLDVYLIKFIGDENLELPFQKFQSLDIAMMINADGDEYGITKDTMMQDFTAFELYNAAGDLLWSGDLDIQDSSYILESELTAYYDANSALPDTELESSHVYPRYLHEVADYLYITYIALAVYVVVVIVSFYIVFILRKKYMGKKEPSEYYKKERSKYMKV